MTDISDEFYEAFHSGVASHCVTCGCGITHFSSAGCWAESEPEYDAMVKRKEECPDKYNMMDPNEAASLIDLGVEFVYGCECQTVQRYEKWIWKHRERILKYLKSRSAKEVKAAQENLDRMVDIANM
jgi:hypothetical protein